MNKNNSQVKIIIVEGFAFIFLSLLLTLAWFSFSDFSDGYNLAQDPILIGTETKSFADGSYITNYIYKNPPILYILHTLSATIILLPILTTLSIMWKYILSSQLSFKNFLKSFSFVLWLNITFLFLSFCYFILKIEKANLNFWWELSLLYMVAATIIILLLSGFIISFYALKQKLGKVPQDETRTR